MHGRHRGGAQVGVRLDRLLRIGVHRAEHPAGRVGADRQQGEVDPGVGAADVGEEPAVAAVAGEVDPAPGAVGEHPAAPQGAAGVGEGAPAPVVGGHEVEAHAAQFGRLPPVEFGHPQEAAAPEPSRRARPGRSRGSSAGGA